MLRRPPALPVATHNETMRREARVLAALATSEVPHPRLIAACPDESVLGVAFYLMQAIDGSNPTVVLPEPHRSSPALRHAMGLALVDGIAALGRIDYVAVGLGDFGKAENYLARQVDRWRRQLASYEKFEGTHARACAGDAPVATGERLHRHAVHLLRRALLRIR